MREGAAGVVLLLHMLVSVTSTTGPEKARSAPDESAAGKGSDNEKLVMGAEAMVMVMLELVKVGV